ncbi:hypothetical protein [Ornithinibacillus contaminans]|uniref:hypothetical protein n=1 Tax=Ornithinibacillus contaminans TaxID=694055 RepID=UPI00069F810F|nr:hypothetical protein [Ornithinibacillus contaminans]
MTPTLILILSCNLLQVIGIFFWNTYYRKELTPMHGMVVSMTLGMTTGTLFGLILGMMLNGELFTSTIIAILIGLTIGYLAGLPFGIVAVIDGAVSGLMGGMMGAMLGEMMPMANPDAFFKLVAFFIMLLLLIVQYAMEHSIKTNNARVLFSISKHPYVYLFAIVILFFLLKNVDVITIESHDHRF